MGQLCVLSVHACVSLALSKARNRVTCMRVCVCAPCVYVRMSARVYACASVRHGCMCVRVHVYAHACIAHVLTLAYHT